MPYRHKGAIPAPVAGRNPCYTDFEGCEVEKALKFIDQIYKIQKQAQEILQWANEKAKAQHEKRHIPHSFQIAD